MLMRSYLFVVLLICIKRMVNFRYIYIALLLLVVGSCAKDPGLESTIKEGDTIKFSIQANSLVDASGITKAETGYTENTIHRGCIIFFTTDGLYKGHEVLNFDNLTGNNTSTLTYKISDDSYSNTDKIVCVFNYDKTLSISADSDFSDMTHLTVSSYFPMSSGLMSRVIPDMNNQLYEEGMPMYVYDFTDSDISTREVYRSLAKLQIAIAEDLLMESSNHSHFFSADEVKYNIVNSPSAGNIGFTSLTATNPCYSEDEEPVAINDIESVVTSFPYQPIVYEPSIEYYAENLEDEIYTTVYMYEFPHSNMLISGDGTTVDVFDPLRFAIILQHTDPDSGNSCYYKLNLSDKPESAYYDIERNHSYTIVIKSVDTHGYSSIKEAYSLPPSNIEYEVYDDMGNLTLSNGQYAISMDETFNYNEIIIYGDGETILSFENMRYIFPEEMTSNDLIAFENMTNIVDFEVISSGEILFNEWGGYDYDSDGNIVTGMTIDVIQNDFSSNNKLTDEGRDIILSVSGSGTATFKLQITLGNLEIGSALVSISKGDGDGAVDAHPGQVWVSGEYIDDTWASTDLDFGARYYADSLKTMIYFGENVTPTGYLTMDGYIASSTSKDSYPTFSEKTRSGFYSYLDSDQETHNVKIIINQLAPFYVGHFGKHTTSTTSEHYYNALVVEKIEEIVDTSWRKNPTGGVMKWSESSQVYYNNIYGQFYTMTRYLNLVDGLDITKYMVENFTASGTIPLAAKYCYMKNDVNGDGVIDSTEPIVWYLPAQNQMLSMWVSKHLFELDPDYDFELTDSPSVYYWTCSEVSFTGQPLTGDFTAVTATNMLEGEMITTRSKTATSDTEQAHVRCVRGITYGDNY